MIVLIIVVIILYLLIRNPNPIKEHLDIDEKLYKTYNRLSYLDEDKQLDFSKDDIDYKTVGPCHAWPYLYHIGFTACDRLNKKDDDGWLFGQIHQVECPAGFGKPLCVRWLK
jgi:hypothetical protein